MHDCNLFGEMPETIVNGFFGYFTKCFEWKISQRFVHVEESQQIVTFQKQSFRRDTWYDLVVKFYYS